jgi:phage anti-repressor protein
MNFPAVDARELHKALYSRQTFASWIIHFIKSHNLVDGFDYIVRREKSGGRPKKEYTLTISAAEKIARKSWNGAEFTIAGEIIMSESDYKNRLCLHSRGDACRKLFVKPTGLREVIERNAPDLSGTFYFTESDISRLDEILDRIRGIAKKQKNTEKS